LTLTHTIACLGLVIGVVYVLRVVLFEHLFRW